MLPPCNNFEKCGNEGFVYVYGKFYCGDCVKKAQDKLKAQEEAILEE